MATSVKRKSGSEAAAPTGSFIRASDIIGWKHPFQSKIEVHEAIRKGFPGRTLTHTFDRVVSIPAKTLSAVVGVSYRTVQRRSDAPAKPLSEAQSYRLWKFAEILASATELQGDQKAAEAWLSEPAPALDRHTPLDLMTTPAGAEIVEELLTRLKYGVYS
jgi:putative toxin-antitoxin system antitoxin component (TIGR02293 family)